ncbi:MAG: dihydropteroate synthase [Actinomycetota bacterium]|nr:dihydropteroate synthase [Actinomycetota bacterium]
MKLRARDHVVDLSTPQVMGILNVTPDSFSDGGLYLDTERAVQHANEMIEDGATFIDVGGESTRPGADEVPEDEELHRVLPVIEQLAGRDEVLISIDTRKHRVARAAIEAGATIINDTSGEDFDDRMGEVAAELGAGIIVMHSRGTPSTMTSMTDYGDLVGDVVSFLSSRAQQLQETGVPGESIALDPGFGFAKTPEQNLTLLNRLDRVVEVGYPVVAGTSRKSFIGRVLDLPETDRIEGTAATVVIALDRGAHILRVHDVKQMSRVVTMTRAVLSARD